MFKLITLLLFLSNFAHAITYKSSSSELYPYIDILELSKIMKKFNFLEMDLNKKGNIFNNSFDQWYINSKDLNQIGILKFDLDLDTKQQVLKISENEFVCHGQTSRGRDFAFYVKGKSESQFKNICQQLTKKEIFSFRKYLLKNLLRVASAQTSCDKNNTNLNQLSNIASDISQSVLAQKISTCAVDAVRAALKTYKGTVDGVASILTNPIELWHQISQQAEALKDFVMNLKTEVMGLYNSVKNLDPELIWTLACQLGGELLASASLSALGGAGLVKLTQKLVQIFSKLKNSNTLLTKLSVLSKLGKSQTAKEILSCVVK